MTFEYTGYCNNNKCKQYEQRKILTVRLIIRLNKITSYENGPPICPECGNLLIGGVFDSHGKEIT